MDFNFAVTKFALAEIGLFVSCCGSSWFYIVSTAIHTTLIGILNKFSSSLKESWGLLILAKNVFGKVCISIWSRLPLTDVCRVMAVPDKCIIPSHKELFADRDNSASDAQRHDPFTV
jgi:hypothetical protein